MLPHDPPLTTEVQELQRTVLSPKKKPNGADTAVCGTPSRNTLREQMLLNALQKGQRDGREANRHRRAICSACIQWRNWERSVAGHIKNPVPVSVCTGMTVLPSSFVLTNYSTGSFEPETTTRRYATG
ncbi:hypothetical protein TcG_10294 [Trypanosoma cruzi]|nr:hypothetical protein TcG_10294 [Trypanosoma cruzi]